MLKGPFTYEKCVDPTGATNWRIADAEDCRVATCYDSHNAQAVTAMLNAVHYDRKHVEHRRKTADYDWPIHPELGAAWTYEPDGKDNTNG